MSRCRKMWSNQENRVRKQVKNPCEAVRYAMHSSGKNSLVTFTKSSQKISTHLLTVLIIGVILHVEQRKRKEWRNDLC